MQPWQDGWHVRFLLLGFEQTLLGGCLLNSTLAQGTSSAVRSCIHSRR